jgi:hypothetical protein
MVGRRHVLFVFVVALLVAAFAAPAAQARDFNCDASAVRLQLGGQTVLEPAIANRGVAKCLPAQVQQALNAGPVAAGVLLAETKLSGVTEATAHGGLASLAIGPDALAGLPIPTLDAIDQIPATTVPIPLSGQLLGLPSTITIDVRPAVKSLVATATTSPLLEVEGSEATAKAVCDGSTPKLSGESVVARVKALGQLLPTDAIVDQALKLYDGQTINPGNLDLSQIVLPPGLSFTDPLLGTILQNATKDVLAAMPPITLPETLLKLSIKRSSQEIADGGLTQRGLSVALSLLGQNVLNAVIGEARISNDSVTCQVQTPAGAVAPLEVVHRAALSCGSRRLALLDVLDKGDHVALYGAADRRLAGKRIKIRSRADGGKVVARPRVSKQGLFRARAPLPPERWRDTNRARYTAVHGKTRSLSLKLHRRMYFTSVRSRHGKVLLRGQVTSPRLSGEEIIVRQRLTCHKQIIVARLKPDANGRFKVRLKAPRNGDIGVYRATTMVAYPDPDGPDFRTYTLPGLVRFAR